MKLYRSVAFLVVVAFSGLAFAEGGCPTGYTPMPQQYQDPASGTLQMRTTCVPGASAAVSAAPSVRWIDRWGAVATDGPKGILGIANGATSERSAVKSAMKDCKEKGGNCRLQLAYRNQCAVLVSGDRQFLVQGAENIEIATNVALKKCATDDVNCRVHYSGCSYPEKVR